MALLEFDEVTHAKLLVVGCGGGGSDSVNALIASDLARVEFCAVSSDVRHLESSMAGTTIEIDAVLAESSGIAEHSTGSRKIAGNSLQLIEDAVSDADMVFVTAGMVGGAETGTVHAVARAARDANILTIGVVTESFGRAGTRCQEDAVADMTTLSELVDTLVVVPDDRTVEARDQSVSMDGCFNSASIAIGYAVRCITDLMVLPGLIGIDFADIRSVFRNHAGARIGVGYANGANRADEAAARAVSLLLLQDVDLRTATSVLINITGDADLSLHEVNMASSFVLQAACEDANIIFGSIVDPRMSGAIRVTVVATGLD